jgi:hypothetical protein
LKAAAMDSGDEPEGSNNNQHQRKQYHRHTPHQIQQLEAYALRSPLSCSVSFLCVLHVVAAGAGAGAVVMN